MQTLGAIVARTRRIGDGILASAAKAVASLVDAHLPGASLLPQVEDLRTVSATVAVEVAKKAENECLARMTLTNVVQQVHDMMWQPAYTHIGKGGPA